MNSHQKGTIQEITKLVQEENIDTEAALRLTLASQLIIAESLDSLEKAVETRIDDLGENVEGLRECVNKNIGEMEAHLEKYPSVVWFWMHRRKTLIFIVLITMLVYTVLFGWVNISDIRQAILHQLGLPPDLGLGVPPTPLP